MSEDTINTWRYEVDSKLVVRAVGKIQGEGIGRVGFAAVEWPHSSEGGDGGAI